MCIIKIPNNREKLQYVNVFLKKIADSLTDYCLVNCTESPLYELTYVKKDGFFYRTIETNDLKTFVKEANYQSSYMAENLPKQGYTLSEYIDLCILFELNEIKIIHKKTLDAFLQNPNNFVGISTITICPDGFPEIHVQDQANLLKNIISNMRCV